MYETYLQNEREFDENEPLPEHSVWNKVSLAYIKKLKSKNRLSRIKEMKALEKELEGKKAHIDADGRYEVSDVGNSFWVGHNCALDLSLDKIREFISQLEKGV